MHKINDPHPIEVCVPGSKSITNRALLIAALSEGQSRLEGVLFSDDSRHFIDALKSLGFPVEVDEPGCVVTITGFGGKIPCVNEENDDIDATVDVGSAGTAARFLAAYLGLSKGRFRMVSSDQMKKRPMKELLVALEELGAEITFEEEEYHFPFIIGNPDIAKNNISIDVDKSSQFLSALLITSVLFKDGLKIDVTGSHGMAYVEMTIKMMEQFGVKVSAGSNDYRELYISSEERYSALDYSIEPDLSAACYFYAMSPLLKVSSKVKGVHKASLQGDIEFLTVLTDMGCTLVEETDGIKLFPPADGIIKGGEWDLSSFSDQALTLAAIAPFADSKVCIKNVGHIRFQECDRINAICTNLSELGIEASEEAGTITVMPGIAKGCAIETYEDHRVAMSFSLPGLLVEDVIIKDPMCCRKTFETYFDVLESCVY